MKFIGAEGAQRGIETQQTQLRQPAVLQQAPALAQIGQPGGRIVGLEILARQRLEAQHHGRQLPLGGMLQQPLDQRLVTQVQAVEAADGDDTVAGRAVSSRRMSCMVLLGVRPQAGAPRSTGLTSAQSR